MSALLLEQLTVEKNRSTYELKLKTGILTDARFVFLQAVFSFRILKHFFF